MNPAIWVVVAAAILSGFFALNHFSLRSFSRSKLEEAFEGAKGQRRLKFLDHHLKGLQLTLLLCNAVAQLALIVGMIRLLDTGYEWGQIAWAVLSAVAIIAVMGIAIPHAWADCAAERILVVTLPVLMVLRYLLYPATAIMWAFDLPIRRLSGQIEAEGEDAEAEEAKQEILQAAADGAAEGAVDADEVEMIESVMEFGDTDAAAIMTPRTDIFALASEISWTDAAAAIYAAGHTRVPIYEENLDNITGIVYAKDLLQHVGGSQPVSLREICRKPFFVPETKPLDDLLREFKARKVHLAVVLDEYGGTAGLVSIEDVLEEIVGEISDEYDETTVEQVKRINETTAEVDGRLRVDELNDLLELQLPEDEDYDTVAGYVVSQFGYIPTAGETLSAAGAEFKIVESDERKISRLRVEKSPEDKEN